MTTTQMPRLRGRLLSVEPDPIAITRALVASGLGGVALLHAAQSTAAAWRGALSFAGAAPDAASQSLDPIEDDDVPASGAFASTPRWIGVIPYEARRELERASWCEPDQRTAPMLLTPRWRRYRAMVRIDPRRGQVMVVGDSPQAIAQLADAVRDGMRALEPPTGVTLRVEAGEDAAAHVARVRRAVELIHAGEFYQVSLARRLALTLERGDAVDLYARMAKSAGCPFGAFIEIEPSLKVLSTSPELLLRADVSSERSPRFERLTTEPIKGTRPRGEDAREDARLARELDADPKERAELAMIIDVERNDLSRVCRPGSVRIAMPPRVFTHRTVHHRVARLVGAVRAEVTRRDVLMAMVPSGSVTGAPKVHAMEVIRTLERERRGLYTGGIGFVSHDGALTLSMAIRTAVMRGEHGHYWTGGGIVADSDPERELSETRWKALQLDRNHS
jgi:anthranilate/para-aminobenzoate synthase component I